jgi:hypothetical protein
MYRIRKDAVGLTIVMAIATAMALSGGAQAQTTPAGSALPRLVRFSGTAKDAGGNPVTGVTGITFTLYAEQTGGAPLWSETQSVQDGPDGRYTVLLGAAKSEGLPTDLFTAEQAHWVGVSVEGQAEQPRILLVSAPYALKSGDAETLGGLPPSAFLMAAAASPGGRAPESPSASPAAASAVTPAVGGTGTADYIPLWTDSSGDLGNSAMFQSGSGSAAKIGINTTTPATTLDVEGGGTIRGPLSLPAIGKATATAGQNSQPLTLAASAFNSATSSAVAQTFQWQAEPVGNDTPSFSASMNLLFADGKSAPAETGLSIASNGQIAFAAGQSYPGSITGVTAGTDLTGGGATGNITLNLDTTKVPQLATKNTFTANQTVDGKVTATSFSGGGANVTDVDASELGGLAASAYAQLAASNTFSGQQIMTGTNTSGVLQVTNTVTSGQGPAIVGTTDSSAAAGIKGIVAATSGTEAGVVGSTSSPNGFGLYGQSPNVGVYGSAGGSSKLGATDGTAGVWGDTGGQAGAFAAVQGTADENIAGLFTNNSQYAITLLAENLYAADGTITVFEAAGSDFEAGCYINGAGDLVCTGAVSGAVRAGARKVSVYATQSTENWLEDAGAGQLLNGSTRIDLDPTFAQTVNTGVAYHVFLTPKGDCKGLYIGGETAQGFEVHEMGGGRSNIAFDYRIMAKRNGFENVRMADVTKKSQDMEQQRKARRERTAQRRAQQAEPNQ